MLYNTVIGNELGPTVAILHGILGSGLNWRSFCQRLMLLRSDLRFVLVDLRNHGRSPKFESPNGLLECAKDVLALQETHGHFSAIVGHSFGGKVALKCSDICEKNIIEVWALDSNPSTLSGREKFQTEATETIRMLKNIPMPVSKRVDVMNLLLQRGATKAVSQWMTTNLKRESDGYYWRFNMEGVEEMINDYFRQDLWHVLEKPRRRCHIVRALQSDRWSENEISRLEELKAGYHCIDAGHWIHSDNPEALKELLYKKLLPTKSA
jgi:esterase